jgi:hypothetical protein
LRVLGLAAAGVAGVALAASSVRPQPADAQTKLPDLAIEKVVLDSHSSGRFPPYFLRSGSTITPEPTVVVTVRNLGATTLHSFYLTAEITGAVEEGHKPKRIDGLAHNAMAARTFAWEKVAPKAFGEAEVRIAIDPQGKIRESNRHNNSKLLTFAVMPSRYDVPAQTLAKEIDVETSLELRTLPGLNWSFEGEDRQVPSLDYQLEGGLQYNATITAPPCYGKQTGYGGGNGDTRLRVEVPIGAATPHYDTVIMVDNLPLAVHVSCGGSPPDYDAPVPWLGFRTGLMRSATGVSRLMSSLTAGPVSYTWDFVGVP